MKKTIRNWTAGWIVIAFTWMAIGIFSPDQIKAGTVKTESTASTVETVKSDNSENNSFEKEGTTPEIAKKKKFPWLWVAAGVVVAGVIVYFTLIKKPKYELTVETGDGVIGTPNAGKYSYKKGEKIIYNLSSKDGFKNLTVLLDGNPVTPSGTILMDKAHTLKATAAQMPDYSLVVKTSEGVNGSPAAGTYQYREGISVSYHYTVAAGYKDLSVLLNGKATTASGTIIMDQTHNLEATAAKLDEYTLIVKTDAGINGSPIAGTYHYQKGTEIPYNYSTAHGILFADLDNNPVPIFGSLLMDGNHVLEVSFGSAPDIRGKWRFKLEKMGYDLVTSFYGEKTSGTIDLLEDPNNYWLYSFDMKIGKIGDYESSSLQVLIKITEINSSSFFDFILSGDFTSADTMIGTYKYYYSDPSMLKKGTWTAARIK